MFSLKDERFIIHLKSNYFNCFINSIGIIQITCKKSEKTVNL